MPTRDNGPYEALRCLVIFGRYYGSERVCELPAGHAPCGTYRRGDGNHSGPLLHTPAGKRLDNALTNRICEA